MSNSAQRSRGGLLDPIDRNPEILFGLFMVLTFTGTLSAATAGREDVRIMLLAAIGCNAAWGIVDGVMYVLRRLVERGRKATLVREVRAATAPEAGQRLVAVEMGDLSSPMTAKPGVRSTTTSGRKSHWVDSQLPSTQNNWP